MRAENCVAVVRLHGLNPNFSTCRTTNSTPAPAASGGVVFPLIQCLLAMLSGLGTKSIAIDGSPRTRVGLARSHRATNRDR